MWTSGTKFADILCGPKCEQIRVILTFSTHPFVFEDFQLVPLSVFSLWETTLPLVLQTARLLPLRFRW